MVSAVRYQVVLLDPAATGQAETLQATLRVRLTELGIDVAAAVAFLTDTASARARDRRAPTAAVYFGGPGVAADPATEELLGELVRDAVLVVPVVPDLRSYADSVPGVLHPINGMGPAAGDPGRDAIAGRVLEGLALLRSTRSLFISYRRVESRGVALQLHDALDERGFTVFLDTHSVRVGEAFQETLWHRLTDADVMVLLDTPGFIASRWTAQELAEANNRGIGIVQAIWPRQSTTAKAALGLPLLLTEADFVAGAPRPDENDLLTDSAVARITAAVESHRARSLAARHTGLVTAFCRMAEAAGCVATVQPERYIRVRAPGSRRAAAVVPHVGVPTSVTYHEAAGRRTRQRALRTARLALLYDHLGIRREWLDHLAWLNRSCQVRSLRLAEAKTWLEALSPS